MNRKSNKSNKPTTLEVLDVVSQWLLTIVFVVLGFEVFSNLQNVVDFIKTR